MGPAVDLPGGRDDGLAEQPEAVAAQRVVQLLGPFHTAAVELQRRVLGVVDLYTVASTILRQVAGGVGGAEHHRGVAGVGINGDDADARGDLERAPVGDEVHGLDRAPVAVGDLQCPAQVAVAQQQRELVAAEAREHIPVVDTLVQQLGDLTQQGVARAVAGGVVDHPELVDVEVAQSVLLRAGAAVEHRLLQRRFECGAVGQAGEGVVGRLVAQFRLDGAQGR